MADIQGFRKAALAKGYNPDQVNSYIEKKTGLGGWLSGGKSGFGGVLAGAGNILNLPSYALGGVANQFQRAIGSKYGQGQDKGLGVLGGIKNKRAVMTELPETIGVDPYSTAGKIIGFGGELLTPDLTGNIGDLYKGARAARVGTAIADDAGALALPYLNQMGGDSLGLFARGARKAGESIDELGANTPFRGLGKNKTSERLLSQLNKSGMSSDEFMDQFGLWSRSADDATGAISDVNRARRSAVAGAGDIPTTRVVQALDDEIARLTPAAGQSRSAAAQLQRVQEARDSFLDSITSQGATPLSTPLSKVEESKQFVSKDIPQSYFNLGASQTGTGRGAELARRRFKGLVDETTGQTGKLGAQESALYNFRDLAKSRELASKGNMNLPFTKLVGAGAGGVVGGFPGAVAGAGAQAFANSPTGLKLQSKLLRGAGQTLQDPRFLQGIDTAAKYGTRGAKTGFRVSQQPTREKQLQLGNQSSQRQVDQRENVSLPTNSTPSNTQIKLFSDRDKKKRRIF